MTSNEVILELRLTQLNNKLIMWIKLYDKLPFFFIKNKIMSIRQKRDQCWNDLRTLIRQKYPEKFIGYNYGQ